MAPALKTLLALAALAILPGAVQAITVPQGAEEGVYKVEIDAAGVETHIRLDDGNTTTSAPALRPRVALPSVAGRRLAGRDDEPVLEKRVSWPSGTNANCKNDYFWAADLYNSGAAWDKFFNNCYNTGGVYQTNTRAVYAYHNGAVAYMCNYSNLGNPCWIDEWVDAVNWLQGACTGGTNGWNQAAYLAIPSWLKAYGYDNAANSFCY